VGIGLAVVAVLLAIVAIRGGNDGDETEEPAIDLQAEVTVVEAVSDIPVHRVISDQDVTEVQVLESEAPAGRMTSAGEVIGQAYRTPLVAGQRLLSAEIERPGLASEIRPGYRAIAVPADTASLLSGLIQDDDFVDVVYRARINVVRLLGSGIGPLTEDEPAYSLEMEDDLGWIPIDFVDEIAAYPPAGDPGSQVFIRYGTGDDQQLEPIAKVMLQDLRVLRDVRPGQTFDTSGQPVDPAIEGESPATDAAPGYLIIEATNQQAEALAFMQDELYDYQVIVRARGDHQTVSTTGITFEILAANEEYGLPVPGSVTVQSGVPLPGDVRMPEELETEEAESGTP